MSFCKLPSIIFLAILASFIYVFNCSNQVLAGSLSPAFVVFNREQVNTATGGTVCSTPETVATEGRVVVTFPTNFAVNTTAANWTVNTTNLPSDSGTAWPGVATATSVSGKAVTFPSADLTPGTTYCFNFSGTNTLTTPATENNDIGGTIATQTGGGGAIDSITFYPFINDNDQVSITGVVPNNVTAYETNITCLSQGNIFSQNTTINYQISYGTTSASSQDISLVASWSDGNIVGGGGSVDILDYVVGSASNAYGGAIPIIDPVNQTITWNITNFPANTQNQTVTFSLMTNSAYTGSSQVSFTTSSWIEVGTDETTPSTVTKYYLYNTPVGPSSSPTSAPSSSSQPVAPSASPITAPLRFTQIKISKLISTAATILASLNGNAEVTIRYGKNPKALDQKLVSLPYTNFHQIELLNLSPNTIYFFQLTGIDQLGNKTTSEMYTFKTAKVGFIPKIEKRQISLVSGTTILDSLTPLLSGILGIVLPTNTEYEFRIPISNYQQIKSVKAFVKNQKVLGISTQKTVVNTKETEMIELYPGVFSGRLQTANVLGNYQLFVEVEDYNGAIFEEPVLEMKVVKPFYLIDSKSQKGIEGALVKIFFYNFRTKTYELLSPQAIGVENPVVSITHGLVPVVLPEGRYRAEIVALRYNDTTVDFDISFDSETNYPQVELKKAPFNILVFFKYYYQIFLEVMFSLWLFIEALALSQRIFDLLSFLSILTLVFLTLLVFSLKIGTPIWHFKLFVSHINLLLFKRNATNIISGITQDNEGRGIIGVRISLIDRDSNKTIAHTESQSSGRFALPTGDKNNLRIMATKEGYQVSIKEDIALGSNLILTLNLENEGVIEKSKLLFEQILNFSLGILIILGLVIEVSFVPNFGIMQTLPFIVITLFNLLLWSFYVFRRE